MPSKKHLLTLSLILLILTPFIMADMGPKPGMNFELEYEISPVPDIKVVTLLECEQEDCSDGVPLEEFGPQGIRCANNYECDSLAYGYNGTYFQLVLGYSDGVARTSNTFTKHKFNARYAVTVTQDALVVEANGGSGNPAETIFYLSIAAICCLGVVVIAAIVLIVRKLRRSKAEQQAKSTAAAAEPAGFESDGLQPDDAPPLQD